MRKSRQLQFAQLPQYARRLEAQKMCEGGRRLQINTCNYRTGTEILIHTCNYQVLHHLPHYCEYSCANCATCGNHAVAQPHVKGGRLVIRYETIRDCAPKKSWK